MEYEFYLPEEIRPKGFVYPQAYRDFLSNELPNLEPWHFFYSHLEHRFNGLKERYPKRKLVPFARRDDNDDIACFDAAELSSDPKVIIIHDWASEGWENNGEYPNFLAWVELAKIEAEEWKEFWKHQDEL